MNTRLREEFFAKRAKRMSVNELHFALMGIKETLRTFILDQSEHAQRYVEKLWTEHDAYTFEYCKRTK